MRLKIVIVALIFGAAPFVFAFDPVAATNDYLATVSAEDKARSDAYFEGGYWLQLFAIVYSLVVFWVILASGLSKRLRDFAESKLSRPFGQSWAYGLLYLCVAALMFLPLNVYSGYFREHAYDLSNQTLGEWFGESLTSSAISIAVGAILIALIYLVVRRAPKVWWLWTSGVVIAFAAFGSLIAPVYIAPLFNEYKVLQESPVQQNILSMARANGVPVENVYQFDASKQSTRISANVSGMFGTTRISLNDNLMDRSTPPEIASVMGHEIGHYALGHVYERLVYIALLLMVGFAFVDWAFNRCLVRWGQKWGVRSKSDPAGLPLAAALISVYFFVVTPVNNSIIRSNEAEADIYGLNAAREPDGFATIALKLGEYRKLDPGKWEEIIFFDHPSGRSRIQMSMEWKAENLPIKK